MSFAALAEQGQKMSAQLRIYDRTVSHSTRENYAPPNRQRSEKYIDLCEHMLEIITRLGEADRADLRLADFDKLSIRRALNLLKQDGKIVYQGNSPHGYWRVK